MYSNNVKQLLLFCRSLLPKGIEDYALIEIETYENWTRTYQITSETVIKIVETNFYFHLAQQLSEVINKLIRQECESVNCRLLSKYCFTCNLLIPTGVNHSATALNLYLKNALTQIDIIQLKQIIYHNVDKIELNHLDNLPVLLWRTRSEVKYLAEQTTPYFNLRPIDKKNCIYNLINIVSQTCKTNGTATHKCGRGIRCLNSSFSNW